MRVSLTLTQAFSKITTTSLPSATTFTALFNKIHSKGVSIKLERAIVVRIGQDALGIQISQDFGTKFLGPDDRNAVEIVATNPKDANILYCATKDKRIWMTNSSSTASSSTMWTEITKNKPIIDIGNKISSITIDNIGNVFVLFTKMITTGVSHKIKSPLFKVSTGGWVQQSCINLPVGFSFGKIVADPVQSNTLYSTHGAKVYKLTLSHLEWIWEDISKDLPGQWIYDLWIVNISRSSSPKLILRAAIPTRGIWEREIVIPVSSAPEDVADDN